MSFYYAFGHLNWLSADALNHTYTVSTFDVSTSTSFQPKALRFAWTNGVGDASQGSRKDVARGIGFATGTADRRCVATMDQDAAASMTCSSGYRTDAAVLVMTTAGAVDGLLDVNSISATGFQMIVDDAVSVSKSILWEAWGGTEVANAVTGDAPEPAATGVQSYTTNFMPSVVMFAGVQTSTAAQAAGRQDSGLSYGVMTGINNARCVEGNNDDASASSDTDGVFSPSGEVINQIVIGGGAIDARATTTSPLFSDTGFSLNWTARAVTDRRNIWLAIGGSAWWVADALTIDGSVVNSTTTVSGLPFKPKGVQFFGRMVSSTASGTQDRLSFGMGGFDNTAAQFRRAEGCFSEDSDTSATCSVWFANDRVLAYPSNAGAELTAYDLNAINNDGFQVITDVAGGVANELIGYLTFGSARSIAKNLNITPTVYRRKKIRNV